MTSYMYMDLLTEGLWTIANWGSMDSLLFLGVKLERSESGRQEEERRGAEVVNFRLARAVKE